MNNSVSYTIKMAKEEYKQGRSNAFFAAIVPGLFAAVINLILTAFLGDSIISLLSQMFISATATFMSITMLMQYVRTKEINFGLSLKPGRNLLTFIGILSVFGVIQLILHEYLYSIYFDEQLYETLQAAVEDKTMTNAMAIDFFKQFIPILGIQFAVMSVLQIKFILAQFYAVDGLDFVEAFKVSFTKTKGHLFHIILFFSYFIVIGIAIIAIPALIGGFIGIIGIFLLMGALVYFIGFFLPFMMVGVVVLYEIIDGRYKEDPAIFVEDPFEESFNK